MALMPSESQADRAEQVVSRILARSAPALQADATASSLLGGEQGELLREERVGRQRVGNRATQLEEIQEVEYRQVKLERVILVGIYSHNLEQAQASIQELAALANTAGSEVLDAVLQKRSLPDAATYLGSGKAKEVAERVVEKGADTVIVDTELAPSQRRGLEDVVKVKVVDRTALILDIFAQHAKSKEGKAQVELAQLDYLLPRLRGWGESMSRQAGGRVAGGEGIGSRGPGETKIELDRRRIRTRMARLRHQIAQMAPAREIKRAQRKRNQVPAVAIVGYTNAGKSSLLNRLTGAEVMVDNLLFATLDPTVRRSNTPEGREYTLTDTVGFVRSLPHQLVEAFRSTLEEAGEADLLLHIVDGSHVDPVAQIDAVHEVLADIKGIEDIPELIVINKADIATPEALAALRTRYPGCITVSALSGLGIEQLQQAISENLPHPKVWCDLVVPYTRGDLLAKVHETGIIESIEHLEQGTHVKALVEPELAELLNRHGLGPSRAGGGVD